MIALIYNLQVHDETNVMVTGKAKATIQVSYYSFKIQMIRLTISN